MAEHNPVNKVRNQPDEAGHFIGVDLREGGLDVVMGQNMGVLTWLVGFVEVLILRVILGRFLLLLCQFV